MQAAAAAVDVLSKPMLTELKNLKARALLSLASDCVYRCTSVRTRTMPVNQSMLVFLKPHHHYTSRLPPAWTW